MKKWSNLRNAENGRYKLSVIVLSVLLAASLLWQGVFAMLGTTGVDADAFAMLEAFGADVGDGLHEQRQAAWIYAVRNPTAEGGVWGQFWGTAQFGAAGSDAVPIPTPTPTPAQLPPLLPFGLASTFRDTRGIMWRVIAVEGNSRLIMTEHVHMQGVRYNLTNVYTRLSQSNLRVGLDTWGAMNLAPELAARARVPNNVDNDVRAAPGSPDGLNRWREENEPAGWTSPGAAAEHAPEAALFVLSISEVHRYSVAVGTTSAERIARNTAGTAHNWWLRSPGTSGAVSLSTVHTSGSMNHTNASDSVADLGARPALWINL